MRGGLSVGALTNEGLHQAVELGELIRFRFLEQHGLIGRDFDPSEPPPSPTAPNGRQEGQSRREGAETAGRDTLS